MSENVWPPDEWEDKREKWPAVAISRFCGPADTVEPTRTLVQVTIIKPWTDDGVGVLTPYEAREMAQAILNDPALNR